MEKHILIVEDEEQVQKLMVTIFTRAGYAAWAVSSGLAAMDIIQARQYQVYFLDLNLPVISGVELCRRIRTHQPSAIVYAITGWPSQYEVVACREAGFDDYFTKPVERQVLVQAADMAFQRLARGDKEHSVCPSFFSVPTPDNLRLGGDP